MDTLDKSEWDVIIAGTGLPQSLLALSLSRSGKKVLHLDQNTYYGGHEAALSLTEAEEWAEKHTGNAPAEAASCFTQAVVTRTLEADTLGSKLGFSRAYSLALAPQLIYARSNLLPALVSSRTHNQLDFQAVGSWFVVNGSGSEESRETHILRVPSGREDVFRDDSLDLRAKRSLMKFMRFVASYDEESEATRWTEIKNVPLDEALRTTFGLKSEAAVAPLLALALVQDDAALTVEHAVPRIAQHFRSIGMFGPGFSAVLPKWGGLAEIAQVACRACAVGGGVYVLGKGIKVITRNAQDIIEIELSDGEKVATTWLSGCLDDLPVTSLPAPSEDITQKEFIDRGIYIVASSLDSLFPPTSAGGPIPAGAVIRVTTGTAGAGSVNILAHSSESGECPSGQCVLYTSTTGSRDLQDTAVQSLLQSVNEQPEPHVLWRMHYRQQSSHSSSVEVGSASNTLCLPPLSTDVVLGDEVLDSVRQACQYITGAPADSFMKFESRGEESAEEQDTM